ncbi:hypothetical protein JOF56_009077 [Kibdelosporangium banguiense]|uniref:Transglycosylase SLT domain-containing protein n=1 Tax=Kibdelosporangium banguiense TaxID=1365924 RepID=A0ABS4TWB8_9PSEU|nr:hypothetical protein [Kibdelosporangium banguiense]MBP2328692.1 hypothetical protein [Kibdelosporangium banguiense]
MAVVVAVLLISATAAADIAGWIGADPNPDAAPLVPVANGLGHGFFGIDLDDLGATGQLPQVDQLSDQLLRLAGDPGALAATGDPISVPSGPLGIPGPAMNAYTRAASILATQLPNCHLPWYLLASIGRIESNHGNGGQADDKGNTITKIVGPVLDGQGFAAVPDTDHGVWDGDTQWDRAVGPMQLLPSTWAQYASDASGYGTRSPHNFYDAALAAGKFLCSGGLDMNNPQQRAIAVFRYNHSESYVQTVLIWADAYEHNIVEIPSGTGAMERPPRNVAQTSNNAPPTNSPHPPPTSSAPPPSTKVTGDIPDDPTTTTTVPTSSPPSQATSSPPSSTPTCTSMTTTNTTTTTTSTPPSSSVRPNSTSQTSVVEHAATGATTTTAPTGQPCPPATNKNK